MGIGDWGLGIGDWGLGPIPNPQSPIPNPQSPIPIYNIIKNVILYFKSIKLLLNFFLIYSYITTLYIIINFLKKIVIY